MKRNKNLDALKKSISNTYAACASTWRAFDFACFKEMVICGLKKDNCSDIQVEGEWLTCNVNGEYHEINLYAEFKNK